MTEPNADTQTHAQTNGLRGGTPAGGVPRQLQWVWTYAIPAASVIGVLIYGMLRQLYATFYGSLGASPEEVGLGYSETLSLSGIAVLWVLVLPPALVLLGLRLVPRLGRDRSTHHVVRQVAPPIAVLLLAVGVFVVCSATWNATGQAYDGWAVRSVNLGPIQVLGLRAEPAIVWWRNDTATDDLAIAPGSCLLYLGQANGTTVLYDPGPPTARTIRVQTSDVTIDVARAERLPGQRQRGNVRCEDHRLVFS